MKKLIIFILMCVVSINTIVIWKTTKYETVHGAVLDVYTAENIYYINLDKYTVTSEKDSEEIAFKSLQHLKNWLSDITAFENNPNNFNN